jgi:hypothetical protein
MTIVTAEDYTQCQMTLLKVARGLDTHNPVLVAAQFSDQGTWNWKGQVLQGRDAIITALSSRDQQVVTRHITSNLVCEKSGPNRIEATCTVLTYRNLASGNGKPSELTQPVSILDYSDTLVNEGGLWLISQRCSQRIFSS